MAASRSPVSDEHEANASIHSKRYTSSRLTVGTVGLATLDTGVAAVKPALVRLLEWQIDRALESSGERERQRPDMSRPLPYWRVLCDNQPRSPLRNARQWNHAGAKLVPSNNARSRELSKGLPEIVTHRVDESAFDQLCGRKMSDEPFDSPTYKPAPPKPRHPAGG